MPLGSRTNLAIWMQFATYIALLSGLYFSPLKRLVVDDWEREDFNYCYLIPFLVLYLIWEKRANLRENLSQPTWTGVIPLAFAVCLVLLGELAGDYFTQYISFWFVVVSLLWIYMGPVKLKIIIFPLVVMLTMFPLPSIVNSRILTYLKLVSSKLGVMLLHFYGMSAYREGNVIDLGFTQLQVVDACGGLRYIIPLMILSLLMAYWLRDRLVKKAVLFLSAIPIAIIINSMRIAMTGILYDLLGASAAEGFFHGFSGWLIFVIGVLILVLEMWFLRKLAPKRARDTVLPETAKITRGEDRTRASLRPLFIVTVIILGSTLFFSRAVEFREKTPVKKPFQEIPLQIDEWSGKRKNMKQMYIDELKFSDYILVDYTNPQGKTVNLYSAYYESQRTGASIHSPESCLPGEGWLARESGEVSIPVGGGEARRVKKAYMEKAGLQMLMYYWFTQRGRIINNSYELKLYTFWSAVTTRRTDGALVRIITVIFKGETLPDAEARLQKFATGIMPVLDEYIPE